MMRRKNLERAVILGLLLSTGVYGSAWATDYTYGMFFNNDGANDMADEAVDGVYSCDVTGKDEDINVKYNGIFVGDGTKHGELVKKIILSSDKTVNIEKTYRRNSSGLEGAIEVINDHKVDIVVNADSLVLENKKKVQQHTSAAINLDKEKSFVANVNKNIDIKGFNYTFHVGDNSIIDLQANNISIGRNDYLYDTQSCYGVYYRYGENSLINLKAKENIEFNDLSSAVYLQGESVNVKYEAEKAINIINNADRKSSAISLQVNTTKDTGSALNTTLIAGEQIKIDNYRYAIIMAKANNPNKLESNVKLYSNKVIFQNTENAISVEGISNKVTLDDYEAYIAEEKFERDNVNIISADKSAVYAGTGGVAEINGAFNSLNSDRYRTIQASGGDGNVNSQVNINGAVEIVNKYALNGRSSNRIAVVASADENSRDEDAIGGIVNVNLNGTDTLVDTQGNFVSGNRIVGTVIAGKNGIVNINSNLPESASTFSRSGNNSKGSIAVYGNVMAGNNGELNLDLGAGGYLSGRVDDYQDANLKDGIGFFNPEFSREVTEAGTVNLTMGEGSTWDVTGQSWVTKLDGSGTVDMRNGGANDTSHAVHVGTLTGDHTFVMDLNSDDHNVSDMLFIKDEANSSGEQTIYLNSVAGIDTMADGEKLRFATVNADTKKLNFVGQYNGENSYENNKNGVMMMDNGVMNTNFVIEYEKYDATDAKNENKEYNGGTDFNAVKPGDDYVDTNYANGTNWYLTRNKAGDETSDAGKTIINMSKVNYSNAIYMDRLNKRLGEARYINPEEEQGMWVRIRHDRIGKDDAFRSQNTMYEMGYDEKQDCDNGERRVGFAIDYMDGKAEYSGIAGDGDVKRYGLWLYDTWLGDKGHYTDYVLKWGHLENDFDIYTMTRNEKVSGDYSNNVFSASAEYGKKNDMGSGWYFEPQAQLQFARVTGADYVTSQDTKVSLDGINSLIGRAGFRLGRDLNKNSTVYIKADLLHEFLGEQDITATDATGTLREEYENEGTWYDVGFGFATKMSKNSYAFMDFEKSFGNDNDETYQINVGMQWSF